MIAEEEEGPDQILPSEDFITDQISGSVRLRKTPGLIVTRLFVTFLLWHYTSVWILKPSDTGTTRFKNVNNCLNTNIYSCSERSGSQSSNLYLDVVHFATPVLIRHPWQHKTVVFLHWCLIRVALYVLFN
jgi:hypothetical protein